MKIRIPTIVLAALLFTGLPLASSSAFVAVSVGIAPPAIPVYEQPYAPAEGYIWTPGYWAYADFGYYWVPGVWVQPPRVGLLWTPGYWGYRGGQYVFNDGYWGPTVGFYGGINYGFGYGGRGYYGGEWNGGVFRYNTAVTRVNTTIIHNTYVNKTVINNNNTGSRAGFNGPGGAKAKPTAAEQSAAKAEHVAPVAAQTAQVDAAKSDPSLHAANNKGKPKPDAVKAFQAKNGGPAAAANGTAPAATAKGGTEKTGAAATKAEASNQPAAENQAAPAKQTATGKNAGAKKGKAKGGQAADESATGAKTGDTESPHKAKTGHAQHKAGANGAGEGPRGQQHAQAGAPRRPVAGPGGRPQGPAGEHVGPEHRGPAGPGQQPGKKKKKPGNGPQGQGQGPGQ